MFVQPLCVTTCITICAHIKNPKHWQLYHCLNTGKYGTHYIHPLRQNVATQVAEVTYATSLLNNRCTTSIKRDTQKKKKERSVSSYFSMRKWCQNKVLWQLSQRHGNCPSINIWNKGVWGTWFPRKSCKEDDNLRNQELSDSQYTGTWREREREKSLFSEIQAHAHSFCSLSSWTAMPQFTIKVILPRHAVKKMAHRFKLNGKLIHFFKCPIWECGKTIWENITKTKDWDKFFLPWNFFFSLSDGWWLNS